MLSKKRRIARKSFPYILNKGKRFNSPHFVLYLTAMPEENSKAQSKFSFSVSKKILKKAHDRNKYRRWGYSIVGKHIERVKAGYFCFFSFKKGQYPATFLQIEKEVAELLSGSAVLS